MAVIEQGKVGAPRDPWIQFLHLHNRMEEWGPGTQPSFGNWRR